jgi:TonB family protein
MKLFFAKNHLIQRKLPIILLALVSFAAAAQQSVTLYFNESWELVPREHAVYYRLADYDLGSFKLHGQVLDYTMSDTLLMEGSYFNGRKNGFFKFYYPNGQVERTGNYFSNRRIGQWEYFFDNGQLKQLAFFPDDGERLDFSILEFYDSEGKPLVQNGSGKWENEGYFSTLDNDKSLKRLTGEFSDSLRHGSFKLIRVSDNRLMIEERFDRGNFQWARFYKRGSSRYSEGKSEYINKLPDTYGPKFTSTENFRLDNNFFSPEIMNAGVAEILSKVSGQEILITEREAGYAYGDYELISFIAAHLRYPINAVRNGVTGRVLVNVLIDAEGKAREVTLLRGIEESLDEEALRVVSLINDWLPKIENGVPVESVYTIPVSFMVR